MKLNVFLSAFLRGPSTTCDCVALWLYATISPTTLLCELDDWTSMWTANLKEQIQPYCIIEKVIIREEPEQYWKVLTEKDWSELRKYNVTIKKWIYPNFSTCYIIDTFHTNTCLSRRFLSLLSLNHKKLQKASSEFIHTASRHRYTVWKCFQKAVFTP